MAILGVPSTSIVDSTSVGRSLITASDAAAARVIMELAAVDDVTFNSVSSVDGSFSGDVTATTAILTPNIQSIAGLSHLSFTGDVVVNRPMYPNSDGSRQCGISSKRWSDVYSVDGSFSGTLDTEVGGSNRVFNLGSDADVAAGNTEYLETSFDTNICYVQTKETGTGVLRGLRTMAGVTGMKAYANSTLILTSAWSNITLNNVGVYLYAPNGGHVAVKNGDLRPYDAVTPINCGQAAVPWANVYSVDGNFSGDVVMAANVDFTGLPTSDPVVAGRLWNHNDTVKISAG